MAHLTREQQREYEEELEYHRNNQPQSAMDRIVNAAKGIHNKIQEVNNGPTGQAVRRFAERTNAQDGFGHDRAPPQAPVSPRGRAYQPLTQQGPPVNEASTLHPGNRIYVMQGSIIASGGSPKGQPLQRRRSGPVVRRGGLGQDDNGFDDDHGL
ncbi:MAG: hypothetical protein WC626_05390 [Methanoregula sp.]